VPVRFFGFSPEDKYGNSKLELNVRRELNRVNFIFKYISHIFITINNTKYVLFFI